MTNISYSYQQLDNNILHNSVMESISIAYSSYTPSQKTAYKVGKAFSAIKKFILTPQASALGLISFWAAFTISFFLFTLAINTLSAYVVFGLLFLIHTHLTFSAVEALIKEAIAINILGIIND